VQLRGVSTHGLAWFPEFVNEAAFQTIRDDWGANAVRLAMYTCERGGYMTDGDRDALEALIDQGVELCGRLGMYAVIDWHILSDGDPGIHADAADVGHTEYTVLEGQAHDIFFAGLPGHDGTGRVQDIRRDIRSADPVIARSDGKNRQDKISEVRPRLVGIAQQTAHHFVNRPVSAGGDEFAESFPGRLEGQFDGMSGIL
jgi:endoglucanase